MSFTSIVWKWDKSDHPELEPIKIETAKQMDGSTKYAVRHMGCCLTKTGEWEYEPIPSSRDESFLERCRFDTWDNAAMKIINNCEPYGRFTKQVRSLAADTRSESKGE